MPGRKDFVVPKEFFTFATFETTGGCALVTWMVSNILCSVFHLNPGVLGLIVAMLVAYVALYLSKPTDARQYVVTFFNGFLVYATVVGVTSFSPYVDRQTADVLQQEKPGIRTAFLRPWIPDKNVLAAARNLVEIRQKQGAALQALNTKITAVEEDVKKEGPSASRTSLLEQLSSARTSITDTQKGIQPHVASLDRLGVRPPQ